MEREARLILREELRCKLDVYNSIIRRLQFEQLGLWELQITNEREIRRMDERIADGGKDGESDNQPVGGT